MNSRASLQISNTEPVPDGEIVDSLGIARDNTVEARNFSRGVTRGIRDVFGGEFKTYSELLTKARDEAIPRMEADAERMGVDAVVNVRLETPQITDGGSEVMTNGTAIRLE